MRPCRWAARRIDETERKLSQNILEVNGVARAASDAVEVFADSLGWAVLEAPGFTALNLKHDKLISSFAFDFNLRRYTWGSR